MMNWTSRRIFWIAIFGLPAFLLVFGYISGWIVLWKALPPFPENQKGVEIAGVMFHQSITIKTDQNRLYRCSFDVPDRCWYKVSGPDNQDSRGCDQYAHPPLSADSTKSRLDCHLHESHTEMQQVRLNSRGQAEIWTTDLPGVSPEIVSIAALVCGTVFFVPAALFGLLVDLLVNRRWRKKTKDVPDQS